MVAWQGGEIGMGIDSQLGGLGDQAKKLCSNWTVKVTRTRTGGSITEKNPQAYTQAVIE